MSCAEPLSQLSPPSLRLCNASAVLSPCRSVVDDLPFSFPVHAPCRSSCPPSSSPSSSPGCILKDIQYQKHKNSPRTHLCRPATLLSPLRCLKENRECTAAAQNCNIENGVFAEDSDSSSVKSNKLNYEDDICISSFRSYPSYQDVFVTSYTHSESAAQIGEKKEIRSSKSVKLHLLEQRNGPLLTADNGPNIKFSKQIRRDRENFTPDSIVLKDVDYGNGVSTSPMCTSPSHSPLKKKRPTKLTIPEFARLASFGKAKQFEVAANEPFSSEITSVEALLFGVSCRKGRRTCMEDAHTAITNFQGKSNQAFFGVFDGHGGNQTAQYVAQNIGRHIGEAILSTDGGKDSFKSAMHAGYMSLDAELAEKGLDGGACAVSAYINEGHLVIANAGDCKAVLCRNGKAESLFNVHRASDPHERERIRSLGGYVDCFNGVWRVQGTLAVTRALGDASLKKWISGEPDVVHMNIEKGCEFLVLATDGLSDKVSDQEVVDCVRQVLQQGDVHVSSSLPCQTPVEGIEKHGSTCSSKSEACNELISKACSRGNMDDITVMVIPLSSFAGCM
ncbi:hypothetical protein KP509_33G047800 [Ceratopteris richardii]|uniref:protein-serine/threonine phosphatase n=1 Tax=Ceratopteris richardii TaxID=49495 RepID=A0A8T2QPB7_CERRI|nr:hypothetical protein KP509_33G047800 [Ceratopteris richardii]